MTSLSLRKKRKAKDFFLQASTYLTSSFALLSLLALLVFLFSKGYKTISFSFLFGQNKTEVYHVSTSPSIEETKNTFSYTPKEGEYFSSSWGLGFTDGKDKEGNVTVLISYIDSRANVNSWIDSESQDPFNLRTGTEVVSAQLWKDKEGSRIYLVSGKDGAEKVRDSFDKSTYLKVLNLQEGGGGILGVFLSTLLMIGLTMLFSLPLGIGAAIYLALYARNSRFTRAIKTAIDAISGIPSIVFGLVGALVFLPLSNNGRGTLLTGSLTLAAMILPVIIKSTEESILSVPRSLRNSSLALGASENQTVFKVVLPNALGGILTSVLLGIGRVIGESAALIYTSGTAVMDSVSANQGSATLAVYIWDLMSGDTQNYEASCAVSLLILAIVFLLSIALKITDHFLEKKKKGAA